MIESENNRKGKLLAKKLKFCLNNTIIFLWQGYVEVLKKAQNTHKNYFKYFRNKTMDLCLTIPLA